MRDNLDDEQKEHLKLKGNKKKTKKSVIILMLINKNSRGNTRRKERWANVCNL